MGSIDRDLLLPGTPTKTIRVDAKPSTLDSNVYNIDTFNRLIATIKNILPGYTINMTEYSYLFELYTKYDDENNNYNTNTQKEFTDILKNERKTFYEDQGIDSLHSYYYWLLAVYILTVIVYVISFFVFPSDWSQMKKILVLLVLVLLPFGSSYIMALIIRLLHGAYNLLPKNVYLGA
jgi:hypothetical protein